MFKTIVLALDGSEPAKRAIPFSLLLARESQSKIVIAHVDERMGKAEPRSTSRRKGSGQRSSPSSRIWPRRDRGEDRDRRDEF